MTALSWVHDDGGRAAAGFKGEAGDCVARAIAIATGEPYADVYKTLAQYNTEHPLTRREKARGKVRSKSARNGIHTPTVHRYLVQDRGWVWTPTMFIGSGCKIHLAIGEVPCHGPVVVNVSRHIVAVVDGILHDTYDPSRDGTRCVYGWWTPA